MGSKTKRFLRMIFSGSENSDISLAATSGYVQRSVQNIDIYRFSLAVLQKATDDFDETCVIGKGGFGKVYKGVLATDGTTTYIAVKRGSPESKQGFNEFVNEIELLSRLRHRHLVSLLGYCDENGEMILVYEFMEKGTLKTHLYKSHKPTLSWKQRVKICVESARGLHYLHTGQAKAIIHRDIKSENILLDEMLTAKVADFGISKTGPEVDQTHISTAVKGSFGYLDPEYFKLQQLSDKSDVYSFGVVLLEVLCARPALDLSLPKDEINLAEWALKWQKKGRLDEIVDHKMAGTLRPESLREFGKTAEKCLADYSVDRPTMGDVLRSLEYVLKLEEGNYNYSLDPNGDSIVHVLEPPSHAPAMHTIIQVQNEQGDQNYFSDATINKAFSQMLPSQGSWVSGSFGTKKLTGSATGTTVNLGYRFSLAVLQKATDDFNEKCVIGRGGFGKVYKGVLATDGTTTYIAAKRGSPKLGFREDEFLNEIKISLRLRHRHFLSLLGYCNEDGEMILVHEFMEKGSLQSHLYGSKKSTLSWKQRLEMCIGAARGLHYLHTCQDKAIIHRDVKSSNILLDETLRPKVSDLSVARIGPEPDDTHVSTRVIGTMSYLDPEYARSGQLTEKSDVYSFGVMLFEVLCARPAINTSLPKEEINLAAWAKKWQKKGRLDEIVDPKILGTIRLESLRVFGETAEKCLAEYGHDRPTMADVLWNLQHALKLERYLQNIDIGYRFSLAVLQKATDDFDEKCVIGWGGFGIVYKGVLARDGTKIAAKRLNLDSSQAFNEFLSEIEFLPRLRHRHLISLLGYCDEDDEMILVYELMEKGSLKSHLYGSRKPTLSWEQRLEMCIGAARGLHYLHTGEDKSIIHRNVKSSKILLDETLRPKVFDLKFARIGPEPDETHVSTRVIGTPGYLDPEYLRRQQLTEKSDVYSFGVVLFEVLCARPAINPSLAGEETNLAEWAIQWQNKGQLDETVDPKIAGTIRPESLRVFGETAGKCLAEHGADRPTMVDVLWNLQYALQLQEDDSATEDAPPIRQQSVSMESEFDVGIPPGYISDPNIDQCDLDNAADLIRSFGSRLKHDLPPDEVLKRVQKVTKMLVHSGVPLTGWADGSRSLLRAWKLRNQVRERSLEQAKLIEATEASMVSQSDCVDDLRAQHASIDGELSTKILSLSSFEVESALIQSKIDQTKAELDELQSKVDQTKAELDELQKKFTHVTHERNAEAKLCIHLERRRIDLEDQLSTAESEVSNRKIQLEEMKSDRERRVVGRDIDADTANVAVEQAIKNMLVPYDDPFVFR